MAEPDTEEEKPSESGQNASALMNAAGSAVSGVTQAPLAGEVAEVRLDAGADDAGPCEGPAARDPRRPSDTDGAVVDACDGERSDEGDGRDGQEPDDRAEKVEMTGDEMKAMYEAVKAGDVDLLDDLLDVPGADINMELFADNLLMTALRSGQTKMALFLIDNGVDYNYRTTQMDKDEATGVIEWYTIDCRQMAYDLENWDVVEAIDERNGYLWPNAISKPRVIRYKKPPEVKAMEREERERRENEEEDPEKRLLDPDDQDAEVSSLSSLDSALEEGDGNDVGRRTDSANEPAADDSGQDQTVGSGGSDVVHHGEERVRSENAKDAADNDKEAPLDGGVLAADDERPGRTGHERDEHTTEGGAELGQCQPKNGGSILEGVANPEPPRSSSRDRGTSGYAPSSAGESPAEVAEKRRGRAARRATPHFRETKSCLSRKEASLWHVSRLSADRPPVGAIYGAGSFHAESKLWSPHPGSVRPDGVRRCRTAPELVTYRPWTEAGERCGRRRDAFRRTEEHRNYARRTGGRQHRQRDGSTSGSGHSTSGSGRLDVRNGSPGVGFARERFLMKRSRTDLFMYDTGVSPRRRTSPISLDLPVSPSVVRAAVCTTATPSANPTGSPSAPSTAVNITSLLRHRGKDGKLRWPCAATSASSKKNSPAGHLKCVTTKQSV